jgi:DNA helicase-2/ATP-dependent DNA helicase PcrA
MPLTKSELLNGLNDAQLEAVTSENSVILTLAGAGSGKTTVLTRRIAHLHQDRVGTSNMLALTFTRLAGKEMKERVMKLVGEQEGMKLFCNTFHAFAVMILKEWGHEIGLDKTFSIYDQEDRQAILERIILSFGKRTTLKKVLTRFENCKDVNEERINHPEECRVLEEYTYQLKRNNAVDLDRLIDLVNILWNKQPKALEYYQHTYTHVFVDEFQDTSDEQMEMIRLLNPKHLFVVGDDFQAIYGWRGAKVEYIIEFPSHYLGCHVVKLEDNYRSTHQIVDAANCVIAKNTRLSEKKSVAHKTGINVMVHHLADEDLERELVITSIKDQKKEGVNYKNFAVLARTNSQIDRMHLKLEQAQIPSVRVSGNNDVFKKHDIKSMMAWLDFMQNKLDNINLKKALKFPREFIPDMALQQIELDAMMNDISLYEAIERDDNKKFIQIVMDLEKMFSHLDDYTPSNCLRILVDVLGIEGFYKSQGLLNRLEDAETAYNFMLVWENSKKGLGEDYSLSAFLRYLKHRDIQEKLIEEKDAVKLMTIHASKGLEFDAVFITGMNQGVFPSKKTQDFEEERRLFYVAVTRARDQLVITRAKKVEPSWGYDLKDMEPSQFIEELKS